METWYITRRALEFILGASRNNQPYEFAGMLRGTDHLIEEVILLPGTTWHETSATIMLHMLPADLSIIGSVHSHPGPAIPSRADLNFFASFGKIHLIAGYPFTFQALRAFLPNGELAHLEIKE